MHDFVPLEERLAPRKCARSRTAQAVPEPAVAVSMDASVEEVAGAVALIKLAAIEAYERAVERALDRFADDVLGRELRLDAADVSALAARALREYAGEEPVAFAVAPDDAQTFRSSLPVRVDASLSSGDLCVDVRDGTIDARFSIRRRLAVQSALADP